MGRAALGPGGSLMRRLLLVAYADCLPTSLNAGLPASMSSRLDSRLDGIQIAVKN